MWVETSCLAEHLLLVCCKERGPRVRGSLVLGFCLECVLTVQQSSPQPSTEALLPVPPSHGLLGSSTGSRRQLRQILVIQVQTFCLILIQCRNGPIVPEWMDLCKTPLHHPHMKHRISSPLPLHPVPDQLLSISVFLLIRQVCFPQQPLGLILKGGQVSAGAGGQVTSPGGTAGAGGHVVRLGGILSTAVTYSTLKSVTTETNNNSSRVTFQC